MVEYLNELADRPPSPPSPRECVPEMGDGACERSALDEDNNLNAEDSEKDSVVASDSTPPDLMSSASESCADEDDDDRQDVGAEDEDSAGAEDESNAGAEDEDDAIGAEDENNASAEDEDDDIGAEDEKNAGAEDENNAGAEDENNAGADDESNAGAEDEDNAGALDKKCVEVKHTADVLLCECGCLAPAQLCCCGCKRQVTHSHHFCSVTNRRVMAFCMTVEAVRGPCTRCAPSSKNVKLFQTPDFPSTPQTAAAPRGGKTTDSAVKARVHNDLLLFINNTTTNYYCMMLFIFIAELAGRPRIQVL